MAKLPTETVPLKSPLVALIAPVISAPVAVKAPAADTEKPVVTGPNPIPAAPMKIPVFASLYAALFPSHHPTGLGFFFAIIFDIALQFACLI